MDRQRAKLAAADSWARVSIYGAPGRGKGGLERECYAYLRNKIVPNWV